MKNLFTLAIAWMLSIVVSFSQQTVVDIIVNSPDHNTLEAAVIAAELADDLSGDGPFTVFAPTDAAFAALPAGTVEALLDDPQGLLKQILQYHVASDNLLSSDLNDGFVIFTTLQFLETVTVTINSDGIFINNAKVTIADLVADNGVVHVIDAVLIPPTQSVMDIIANSPDHSILTAAINAAALGQTLDSDGPFTVFAPTDAAFNALPAGTIEALLNDIPTLTSILTYHVAGINALSTDLTDGQEVVTLNGQSVTVTINADGVFINDAQVTVADLVADNGVVHVINAVLLPPPPTTVVDIIVNSPDHNTLEAAVIAAELADDLSGDGPFTVFAPTDAAFAALPAGTVEALLDDPQGLLKQILQYHVASDNLLSSDLNDGFVIFTTLQFLETVTVTINSDGIFINNAKVTIADLVADNGVVHVIDAVLIPPTQSVMDIIANSPDHSILTAAINAAALGQTLDSDGPFTVFAPTDAAFNALPAGTIEALLNDIPTLTSILTYHVAGINALSTDLTDGQEVVTLNGQSVTVTINADGIFINDAQVTVADLVANNGVVHVINAVLLPNAVSTEEPFYAQDIKLTPNPVNTTLRLDLPEELASNALISIWSSVGQRVWQGKSSGDTQWIDVASFAKGVYILQIQQNEVSISRKIMVH